MITAEFNGCKMTTARQSLYQYDYEQQLQILGLELPEIFQADFCNSGDASTVSVLGENGVVDIPAQFIADGRDILAYVFYYDEATGGKTRAEITITVMARPERTNEQPTPEQESIIDQAIDALNEGVERAENAADAAEDYARGAETAKNAAEAAQEAAQNAAGAAEQSATDAEAAQQAAETAVTHYPKIVNDFWWVWDAERGEYVNTGVKAKGEDGEGAVLSVNGKTGAVTLDAEDVGALPDSSTLDDIPDGSTYKRPTAAQLQQISTNAAAIALKQAIINASGILKGSGNGQVSAAVAGTDYQTPLTAGTDYATPAQVNAKYTKPSSGIPKADLTQEVQTSLGKADTALQSVPSTYRTAAAQDVIDAAQDTAIAGKYTKPGTGIPENDLASDVQSKIDNALPKTGDGSNVTAAFTAAANRTNISTGEKLSVIFGKIAKWFSDLGSAAFRAATGSITQGSTDLVESGAVYNGLSGKYTKPAGGIPASDLASGVIPSVPSAYTSNPVALGTANPGSATSWARGDHVHPKPSASDIGATPSEAIASVENGATASKNYSAWELIVFQGVLCRAKTTIAAGETLETGSSGNLEQTTVSKLLNGLEIDISNRFSIYSDRVRMDSAKCLDFGPYYVITLTLTVLKDLTKDQDTLLSVNGRIANMGYLHGTFSSERTGGYCYQSMTGGNIPIINFTSGTPKNANTVIDATLFAIKK